VHQVHPARQLAANFRHPVLQAQDGAYWVVGRHGEGAAVARFDGQQWRRFTRADGLEGAWACLIHQTADGAIWVAAYDPYATAGQIGHGLFRYDGREWRRFTEADGLSSNYVTGLAEWPQGVLWVGTLEGLSRLAGGNWWSKTDFEVPMPKIHGLLATADGLWFGFIPNRLAGAMCYDGRHWQRFSEKDGLAGSGVSSLVQAADGALWFAAQKGLSRYDGEKWIAYSPQDGLELGWIFPEMRQMADGSFWIDCSALRAEEMKVVHFRFPVDRQAPKTLLEPAPDHVSARGNILLRWSGHDRWEHTPPSGLRYQWRLDRGKWSPWSERRDHTFTALEDGEYRFEVRAMDREGNVEQAPAMHEFAVDPPWWKNPLVLGLIAFCVGLAGLQTYRYVGANRKFQEAQARLIEELEHELSTARALQMGLMPTQAPRLEGFDIAGRCLPAHHVGGDFFQYFRLDADRLAIVLADVTGHAMEAAIPMVLFAGILESQMELSGLAGHEEEKTGNPGTLEELFDRLNRSLCRSLGTRTFVCLAMGELCVRPSAASTHALRLANGGCPYPYHFRASTGQVVELESHAYPLGVRPETRYSALEVELGPGDCVVFCSDGIIEAANEAGEIFGFERTGQLIRQGGTAGLSAGALIERLVEEVRAFAGQAPQGDDMTCVALRVEG
jgi:serine phosphatase RsbU (regulator of sigma subunit)